MINFVRVNKNSDHGDCTWFRLFVDGELVANFEIPDEYADRLEKGISPLSSEANDTTSD